MDPSLVGLVAPDLLRSLTALAGAVLLARQGAGPTNRRRAVPLAVLAALGYLSFYGFGRFRDPGFLHRWDLTHYYLGGKYAPELEHTWLYPCLKEVAAELDRRPGPCRQRFSPQRWDAFVADARFFRSYTGDGLWAQLQKDRGFLASPAWSLLARPLLSRAPASEAQLYGLALLDPVLCAATWAAVLLTFELPGAAAALVFWGCFAPAGYSWVGGSLLRMDWLAACVLALCLLRRGRPFPAGLLLGYACLARLFPALLLVGPLLVLLRSRDAQGAERRREVGLLLGGVALAALVLVPAASAAVGEGPLDPGPWARWLRAIWTLSSEPTVMQTGLPMLARAAGAFAPLLVLAGAALGAGLLARASPSRPTWELAALSAALVPLASNPAGYYLSVLLVVGLLGARAPLVSASLAALAAYGSVYDRVGLPQREAFLALSAVVVAFSALALAAGRRRLLTS